MTDKPNILFLMVDCLRADKVFSPTRQCKTPFVDELRSRGVSFTQCISTNTTTTPSTTALMTGQFPAFNGVRSHSGYKLNPDTTTVAQHLKNVGYRTIGRLTGPLSLEVGLDRGFDDYQCRKRADYVFGPWGEKLLDELRELKSPWYMHLHFFELHQPRQILPQFDTGEFGRNYYERSFSSLDPTLKRVVEAAGPDTVIFLTGDHGERLRDTVAQEKLSRLLRPITRGVKRVRKMLFPADPVSDAFYETGHGFHVYDELVRVPLVCVGPMFPAGAKIDKQVRHVDIAPTILEAAGATPEPWQINGKSLFPVVRGQETEDRQAYCEAVGAVLPNQQSWIVAIRTTNYKYCYRPFAEKPMEELYDLQADPNEQDNLAADRPDLCKELRERLKVLSQEVETEPILRGEKMSDAEQQILEERLKDLGYIE
jgi:arylsulfatase A-like enzyme